ncbi:uncharacterized protein LOC144153039 isoform X1 [Haemaphysalis longicornis]
MCDDDGDVHGDQPPWKPPPPPLSRAHSIVDELLDEINTGLQHQRPARRFSVDSDVCTTDCSVLSVDNVAAEVRRYSRQQLVAKDETELRWHARHLQEVIVKLNSTLVTLLRQRDRQLTRRNHHYDLVTAVIQAVSLKRRVDTRMRFSLEPGRGESGFAQWMDATKIVVRLPDGIPAEFRKKIWLTLAERYLASRNLDWESTARFCFNERCNPDDDNLGVQIVKDLHRTGCSLFSGDQAEQNQALLKRVLLAYARWNKSVGYCQGFNLLAAFVLEVVEWCDQDALKMMIYLVEGVLPEGYFANNLRGLSVDMAVFRELLRMRHNNLAMHLDRLQAGESKAGLNYEPPLTNVFTMQWFLTLFTTCLPRSLVVRVWDLILLEGNEVLLRTAITIWEGLADRIMTVESADEFYSVMGVLTREMVEFGVKDPHEFIVAICDVSRVPIPQLSELRDRYTYDIRPLPTPSTQNRHGLWLFLGDDEDNDADSDHQMVVAAAFCGISNAFLVAKNRGQGNAHVTAPSTLDPSRMTLDISTLKRQYSRLRQRQRQAHIILTGNLQAPMLTRSQRMSQGIPVNNLLAGQKPLVRRTRPPPPTHAVPSGLPLSHSTTHPAGATVTTRISPRLAVPVTASTTASSASPSTSPVSANVSTTSPATSTVPRKIPPRIPRDPIPVETLSWEQAKKLKAGRGDSSSSSSSSSSTELCDDNNNRSSSPDEPAPSRKEARVEGSDSSVPKAPHPLPDKKPPRRIKNGAHKDSSDSSLSSSSSEDEESADKRAKRRHEGHDSEKTQLKPPRRLAEGFKPSTAGTTVRKTGVRAALVRHREPIVRDDDEDGSYKPDDESEGSRNSSSDSLSSEEEEASSKLETVSSLAEVSSAVEESTRSLEEAVPARKKVPDSLSSETESSRNTFSNMVLSGSDKYNIATSSEASSWKSSSDACLTSSSSGPRPPSEAGSSKKTSDERAFGKLSDEEFQRLSRKFSQSALCDRQAQRMAAQRGATRRGTDELGTQRFSPNIDRSSSEDADRKLSIGSPPRWTPKRTNTSDDTSGESPSTEIERLRRDSSKRGSASSDVSVPSRELRKWSYKYDSRNTSNDVSWKSSDTDYQQASLRYERSISEEDGDLAAGNDESQRPRLLRDDRTTSFKASQESFDGRLLPYDHSTPRDSISLGERRRGSSLTCNTLTTLNEMTLEKADEELDAGIIKCSESSTSSSHLTSPNTELRRSAFQLGLKMSAETAAARSLAEDQSQSVFDAPEDRDEWDKSAHKVDASQLLDSPAQATAVTRGARCASEGSATGFVSLGGYSGEQARPKTARSMSTDATMIRSARQSSIVGGDGTVTLPSIRRQRCLSGDVGDPRSTPPASPRRSLGENYNPFPTRRPSFTGCISDFKVKLGLYSSQEKPAVTSASNGCKTTSVKR